jgi:hypothetical protein
MEKFFNTKYEKYKFTRVLSLQDEEGKIFREEMLKYFRKTHIFEIFINELSNHNIQVNTEKWKGVMGNFIRRNIHIKDDNETGIFFRYFNVYYNTTHIASFSLILTKDQTIMYQLAIDFENNRDHLYFIFYFMICDFNKESNMVVNQENCKYRYDATEDKSMGAFGPKELSLSEGIEYRNSFYISSGNMLPEDIDISNIFFPVGEIDSHCYENKLFINDKLKSKQQFKVKKVLQRFKSNPNEYKLDTDISVDSYKQHLQKYLTPQVTNIITTIQELQFRLRNKYQEQKQQIKRRQQQQSNKSTVFHIIQNPKVPISSFLKQRSDLTVFDILQRQEVPISDFLKQGNTILLIHDDKVYGIYLMSKTNFCECEIIMNREKLKRIVKFDAQVSFYFRETDPIINNIKNGYNIFHIRPSNESIQIIGTENLETYLPRPNIDYPFNCKDSYRVNLSESFKRDKYGVSFCTIL